MGLQQSKDELLYKEVSKGNIEGIKALRSQGAGLEWVDSEKKTPLILACTSPEFYNVAKTLIELGANVNAYRPGHQAGTPLHHAAERGLGRTVELLLSHGANALKINDNCQTPLDIARMRGYSNVVRGIEGKLCLFSGWLRELFGPGFLDHLAPQLLSRKVWVVVLPCGSRNLSKPFKLELAIYAGAQDSQPRTIIPLWKANLGEPNFNQSDPIAIISNVSRIPRRWKRRRCIKSSQEAGRGRIKLAPVQESEKQQLQQFCNACKGIPQVMHSIFPFNDQVPSVQANAPPSDDDQLAMAINASSQFAEHERFASQVDSSSSSASSANSPPTHDKCCTTEASTSYSPSGSKDEVLQTISGASPTPHFQSQNNVPYTVSIPSAPASDAAIDNGPIHYPSINMTPVDLSAGDISGVTVEKKDGSASSCTICLDSPLEGACIPCGHMAGCMSCLNEIKAKKWGCPLCRANIDQIVRIYSV
ncbi:putative E3 ubiquitin-protein ligase XBAT35 [Primulina huaijiensis]|uniref:putative E3 ubiquitin-protein ligase XBAT35 n=1 Tax=Primulina huaijiensis TaxID=1492673 RepID=UPI003CC6EE7F